MTRLYQEFQLTKKYDKQPKRTVSRGNDQTVHTRNPHSQSVLSTQLAIKRNTNKNKSQQF